MTSNVAPDDGDSPHCALASSPCSNAAGDPAPLGESPLGGAGAHAGSGWESPHSAADAAADIHAEEDIPAPTSCVEGLQQDAAVPAGPGNSGWVEIESGLLIAEDLAAGQQFVALHTSTAGGRQGAACVDLPDAATAADAKGETEWAC